MQTVAYVVISLASNRTRCDRRFSVADPSVRTLQNVAINNMAIALTRPHQYNQQ